MLRWAIGIGRAPVLAAAWIAFAAGATWIPLRPMIVLTAWLLAATTVDGIKATAGHDKALLLAALVANRPPAGSPQEPGLRAVR